MGATLYPGAARLLICANGGGSNGYRLRLWKVELQRLATTTGLEITACHRPPGTRKWNKIEHRLFSHFTMNCRGRPLISHDVVVNLIGATKIRSGLRVRVRLDKQETRSGLVQKTGSGLVFGSTPSKVPSCPARGRASMLLPIPIGPHERDGSNGQTCSSCSSGRPCGFFSSGCR